MPQRSASTSHGGEIPRAPRSDARRNRERVLAAAQAAFAADGLAVPLDEIARRAGVGAGTVYRHFPTKEILFAAVVFGRLRRLVDEARSLLEADDPGEAFNAFISDMVEEGATKKDLVDALAGAGIDVDVAGAPVTQELTDAVAALLVRAQRAGAVRGDVTRADVMALLLGTALAIRHHIGDAGASDRIVAVICDGLRPIP